MMTIAVDEVEELMLLLNRVAQGEEVTLTRSGVPVARLVSVPGPPVPGSLFEMTDSITPERTVERLLQLRQRQQPMNRAELLDMVAEGRQH